MRSASLKQRVLAAVQHSVPLTCLAFALDNLFAAVRLRAMDPGPSRHLGGSNVEADLAYARSVASTYLSRGPIHGRVAEVGPGGSAAAALFLVAKGAKHVDLVDRFTFAHDRTEQARLYDAIIDREPRLREMGIRSDDLADRITFHAAEAAAAEVFFDHYSGYDAICSCAVLEHLYEPLSALEAMIGALKPGGRIVHQVDLRDHGMFSAAGHHELTFLTIPEWIYKHMHRRRGRPNRVLINDYRDTLDRLPVEYELLATHLVGVGAIDPAPYAKVPEALRVRAEARAEQVRPKLAAPFSSLAAADLAISAIRISATARD
jgi:SAM-dependent methyltransferase